MDDEDLDKVKGQHIQKVNELEEKIKRLQIYIQDLVKESSNSRKNRMTNTTPDFGDDKQSERQPDSSSDSASNNDMEPASFISNVLVMEKIFGYLDVKQLKDCRLICKEWNEAASSILSKQNNINSLGVYLELKVYYDHYCCGWGCGWEGPVREGFVKQDDLNRAQEMHSIVETAPKTWFRRVYLFDNHFTIDAYKSIFQDFGNRLKFISVTSYDLRIQTLRSILLDWCPNLEELGLPVITFETDLSDRVLQISRPLKLNRLSFEMDHRPTSVQDVAEMLFAIIKNSPDLKTLKSSRFSTVTNKIFSKLQSYPQIMNRLEELFLRCAHLFRLQNEDMEEPLGPLSNIKFESKLKRLVLAEIKPGQSRALIRFLNMTNKSLEKLTLKSQEGCFSASAAAALDRDFQLKQMNRLREFRFDVPQQGLTMDSINILVKMPNLKIFVLVFPCEHSSDHHQNQNSFIDNIFSNCQQLMRNPHKNLEELHLFGCLPNHRDTFDLIHRGFPNLNKLVLDHPIEVRISDASVSNSSSSYCDGVFEEISKLENLISLSLHFGNVNFSPDFRNSFMKLTQLPKLIHLTIKRYGEMDLDVTSFMGFPKLRRLTFIEYAMTLAKTERQTINQTKQLLDERGIFLDVKDGNKWEELY